MRENEQLQTVVKKYVHPYNYTSTVVKISFFHPQNVRFFNSKLGWAADTNQTIN